MNEHERTIAFSRAYALFADIFQQGVNADSASLFEIADGKSESEYGAEHYQLFGRNVFPFEAIFLGIDGLLGGEITDSVTTFYQSLGFSAPIDENADHLSVELTLMAFLSGAESDAIADNVTHQIQRMRQLQRRFLDEHLLRWLPACVSAIQQQGKSDYQDVASQILALTIEHRTQLGDDLMMTESAFQLPDVPDLINDEKTSLRDIASYLLTPSYTGFFLSSDDIKRLGAQFRLPHGFGKRQQILTNLLRTASDYGAFGDVIESLKQMAERWLAFYEGLDQLPDIIKNEWIARLKLSIEMLEKINQLAINIQTP